LTAAAAAVIRAARASDAAAIARLWRALLTEHARRDPAFAVGDGVGEAVARAVSRALGDADSALWVGARGDQPVAFCCARVERPAAMLAERGRVEITELYVEPGARRAGVGRSLADAAFAWARERGIARVEVRVAAENGAGQAFWRSVGFGPFVDVLQRRL
jgi:ribosomal protein S18 acetylase RimI-like enzyme